MADRPETTDAERRKREKAADAIWFEAKEEAIRLHGLDAHEGAFTTAQRWAIIDTAATILRRRAEVGALIQEAIGNG